MMESLQQFIEFVGFVGFVEFVAPCNPISLGCATLTFMTNDLRAPAPPLPLLLPTSAPLSLFSDATNGLRVLVVNVGRKTRRYERSDY